MKINLTKLSWIASSLSIIGVLLNAQHIIWCWHIWVLGSLMWVYWAYKNKNISQIVLWIIFILSDIYGFYSWTHMKF